MTFPEKNSLLYRIAISKEKYLALYALNVYSGL
jgi:hypothetical protein